MHGDVIVCCVASDEALVLLLSGMATYLPDLSAADHLITPCWLGMVQIVSAVVEAGDCRAPLLEECPQHHGHKGDPGVTPGTCGAIGERAQVILVWVRAPGRWERLPPTETRSHEG